MDIGRIEEDEKKKIDDKKKFDELLTLIVDNQIENDKEFENTLNTILIESNSGNLFDLPDAFQELLAKISSINKYNKIYFHLKSNEIDIYNILLSKKFKFDYRLKIFKKLLLFINNDCDNNKCINDYKKFDEDLLTASKIMNYNGLKNNYKSYYSMYNKIKSYIPESISKLYNPFRGPSIKTTDTTNTAITGGKRKNRKTKHAKRRNQKAKSRKNRK
jgi:hypothetical protein